MKSKQFLISTSILATSFLVICIVFAVTKLSPSSSPSSTYHSLNDIYTLITAGTEKATPNSALTTSSSPTATTSHSIAEIYALLANQKQENYKSSTTIFAIVGNYNTPNPDFATVTPTYSSITPTASTSYTGYTLDDLYNLIYSHATSTGVHTVTGDTPGASMHTTTEIYDTLLNIKNNILSVNKIKLGTSIFGITGTYNPTVSLGGSCSSNDDCLSQYCGDDSYWWNVDGAQLCRTGEIGQPCNSGSQCIDGYCGWGQCSNGQIGSYCDSGASCATGFCDYNNTGQCTDGSIGSGCSSNSDCASGLYCGDTGWNVTGPYCTDGSAGQYCGSNSSCAAPNICDTNSWTCVDGSNGAACTSSLGCSSGHCYGDVCTAGTTAVDGCDSGDDCESGYCNTLGNVCSAGTPGSACGGNSECDTYNCVSNVCSADLPPLTGSLVGYWPFNETSGTVANDLSGNGNNGTLVNGTLVNQTGKVGTAFGFDGVNDYVNILDSNSLDLTNAITISLWVKTANPNQGDKRLVDKTTSGTSNAYLLDLYQGVRFITNPAYIPPTGDYISANIWTMITIIYNSSTGVANKYINGSLTQSVTGLSGNFTVNGNPLRIGASPSNLAYFNGFLDEVAIWSRPLAPAEISNLYNGGAGMSIITP